MRSLVSYWSCSDVVILCATMASGIAVALSARRVRPRLCFLPIIGAFEALLSAALFLVALKPVPNSDYWLVWHYGGIAEILLFALLSIEITAELMPWKQFVLAWCGALAILFVLSIGKVLPARIELAVLQVTLAGDFVCALALIPLLYLPEIRPPQALAFIVAGVLTPATIHALCTLQWITSRLSPITRAALPVGTLLGLLIFLAGIYECHPLSVGRKVLAFATRLLRTAASLHKCHLQHSAVTSEFSLAVQPRFRLQSGFTAQTTKKGSNYA